VIRRRFPIDITRKMKREFYELLFSNLLIGFFHGWLVWKFGWLAWAAVAVPNMAMGACLGTFINYSQHFLPESYLKRSAEWDFSAASLQGSSFYDLPAILHWFTANIGFHHIHHFESKIPNYRLAECMRENRASFNMPVVKLAETLSLIQYELWDESESRFVSFKSLRVRDELQALTG
jgi:omega-6 fatty acid desaturase (delta-12 desaturase)